ncbi:hypothetical protein [Bacillus sp. JCM 19034]|uniref:hypothetical protein n=1 Tax=Bacillus sp. JCM 19034 TaxID=1481928 RepID=UPI00078384D0|nr:hypothetical protein [Bacillus sp. JCM 19034]
MFLLKRLSKQEWFIVICGIVVLLFMYSTVIISASSTTVNEVSDNWDEPQEQHELLVLGEDGDK